MEEEIKAEFVNNGFSFDNEEEILGKCLAICIQYQLSASDLVSSWDAYSINRGLEYTVRESHMGAFLEEILDEHKKKVRGKQSGLHLYYNEVEMLLNGDYEDMDAPFDTPTEKRALSHDKPTDATPDTNRSKFSLEETLKSVTPFCTRVNKFVVHSTLNENLATMESELGPTYTGDDIIKKVQPTQKCSFVIIHSHPQPGCRFMYDRIEDKFNFLEDRIRKRAIAYASSGHYEEPVDPSVASQKGIFAVGMICCEEEGHLKEKPVLLQSSVEHSGGQRVRLDLQKLNLFSVFPGQVVGIEGHNPSGHCLIASKIIDHIPLPITKTEENPDKTQALESAPQLTNAPQDMPHLSMIIAAGPFTTSDNLLFEPLSELLSYSLRKQPHVLLLLGPFIDSDHPDLRKGTAPQTYDEMFRTEILGKLQDYVEYMGPGVRVILVPSPRDAHHDFVFPQPAFEVHPKDSKNQIHTISNPGVFSANEVKVACCSVDVLKQLSAVEISRNPGASKQRLANLAKHILNQNSFYPLYPPAEEVPFDFSLAKDALDISSIPDVLVLPSDLAQFVKVLSLGEENSGQQQLECICVNPGRLARGEGGGFFAEINYRGNARSTIASIIRI